MKDQIYSFVGGFLRNPKTMGIVVHSHKMNTQDHPNLVKSCISVNIFHRTSVILAMGPMVMMVMTRLFRRTHRDGRVRRRKRDEFRLFHGYNKFVEESKVNNRKKYAFKSNCFPKTIVAFEPIRKI